MSSPPAPRTRVDFPIAIICALVEEADAVHAVLDKLWSDDGKRYGKGPGDPNAYTPGVIGRHNVVLVHLGEMGNMAASLAAANLKSSFLESSWPWSWESVAWYRSTRTATVSARSG
jgi:hypothetical protein